MKRTISCMLILALLAGILVLSVSAQSGTGDTPAVCPHCNQAWDACDWQPFVLFDEENPAASGHYYLTGDTQIDALYGIGTEDGQSADLAVDICLDLRGFDISRDARVVYVFDYSRFDLLDSVGGGMVSSSSTGLGGTVYVAGNAQFHLHSGTLYNRSTTARTNNAGVIYGSEGSNIFIHGGIVDATAVKGSTSSGTPRGGAIFASGLCEIDGGLILGGSMHQGGSITVGTKGTLRMRGGTVYGGRSVKQGGNIYNYGDAYISGGTIIGGISEDDGGNVYSSYSSSSSKLYSDLHISGGYIADGSAASDGGNVAIGSGYASVTGGTIKGNMVSAVSLTLSGSPIIDNAGYEGLFVSASVKPVIKNLNDDARIVLRGNGNMTTASASPDVAAYLENGQLIPASRYDLQVKDGVLVGSQDDEGYCPHCGENVQWVAYTADTNTSGHYYTASGGMTVAADSPALTIAEGVDMVINLAHSSIKAAATTTVNGTLTLLSGATNAISYTNTNTATTAGGVMRVIGTLNLYDGVIKGTSGTYSGATLYLKGGDLNIYGGVIMNGSGKNGGNIYADAGAAIRMDGGVIRGGTGTGNGGNIYLENTTLTMNGGIIADGTAGSNGGNVQISTKGTLNMKSGMIARGTAAGTGGGNIYIASTDAKLNVYDGMILMGHSEKSGGNIYANNGAIKITGGSILRGEAGTNGGNIFTRAGQKYITEGGDLTKNYMTIGDDATDSYDAPVISGGRAEYGGNIMFNGISTLGAVTMTGGKADSGPSFYLSQYGWLTVEPGFTGTHRIAANSVRITELETENAFDHTSVTQLNATIYVDNYDGALLVATESGKLGLAGAALVSVADGSKLWFKTAQEAADAYTEGTYVRLYGSGNTLQLKGDTVVDVNGFDATITGTGKLYGFDSRNDTYETYGMAQLDGVTTPTAFTAPNGNTYVTLTEEDGTSFHRVDIALTAVVLRPSAAGLYYTGQFLCDDKLAQHVENFGFAASLKDAPDHGFRQDPDTLYTQFTGDKLGDENLASVLVRGVFEEGVSAEQCKLRGEMPLYCKAFMQLNLGGASVTLLSGDQEAWSMRSVLQYLHAYWPSQTEETKTALMEYLYEPYVSKFSDDWGLFYMRTELNGGYTEEEEAILQQRRQTVLDYMRESLSLLWTTDKELKYGLAARDNGTTLRIVPGRVYMGVPYAYAVGTQDSFLEYATTQDEKGIYTISGLEATALNYESYGGRVGNDCSGAVTNAWSQIATSFTASRSAEMVWSKGVMPVGDYDFCPTLNADGFVTYTKVVNTTNGEQRMYEAYAQLLPADAVFMVTTSGSNHIRMISEVYVAHNEDGTIDGENSYVICLEQTRGNQTGVKTKEVDGIGTVYVIGGVDTKYTFAKLFSGNYIPCTIRELRDPTPVEETWVKDTQTVHTAENIFADHILSNRFIDCVRVTILDEDGSVVQEVTGRARRRYNKDFEMVRFVTEKPGSMRGSVDVSLLESGKYRCTVTARLTTGEEYVARDFTFEK